MVITVGYTTCPFENTKDCMQYFTNRKHILTPNITGLLKMVTIKAHYDFATV